MVSVENDEETVYIRRVESRFDFRTHSETCHNSV